MEPVFALPPGIVVPIPDQNAFIAFLEQYKVPYSGWQNPAEELLNLWNEIERKDAVYTTYVAYGRRMPVRFLLTVAPWIKLERRLRGGKTELLVLKESVREGNVWRPRKYVDTSVSEKMKLDCLGAPLELPEDTIARCLEEEQRLHVSVSDVRKGMQFRPWLDVQPTEEPFQVVGSKHVEIHVHEKKKCPGLLHCNQIARYFVQLPDKYHFFGTRLDVGTRYRSWWSPVDEGTSRLDPVPAELILPRRLDP